LLWAFCWSSQGAVGRSTMRALSCSARAPAAASGPSAGERWSLSFPTRLDDEEGATGHGDGGGRAGHEVREADRDAG
jgi:hypothetical protein